MSLHLKYRAKSFDQIVGNDNAVITLETLLSRKEGIPHSFLIHGPKGCGKTTIARIMAQKIGVLDNDVEEQNTADYRRLGDARELIRNMQFQGLSGSKRFFLLDEAHQLRAEAQDCLLKMIEEPPEHVYICLCTTDPQKLKGTVKNRCHQVKVENISNSDLYTLLMDVAGLENMKLPNHVCRHIIEKSDNTPRTALVLLDSIKDLEPEEMEEAVTVMQEEKEEVVNLFNELIKGGSNVFNIVKSLKNEDSETVRRIMLACASNIITGSNSVKRKEKAYLILQAFEKPTYDIGYPGVVKAAYEIQNK